MFDLSKSQGYTSSKVEVGYEESRGVREPRKVCGFDVDLGHGPLGILGPTTSTRPVQRDKFSLAARLQSPAT